MRYGRLLFFTAGGASVIEEMAAGGVAVGGAATSELLDNNGGVFGACRVTLEAGATSGISGFSTTVRRKFQGTPASRPGLFGSC